MAPFSLPIIPPAGAHGGGHHPPHGPRRPRNSNSRRAWTWRHYRRRSRPRLQHIRYTTRTRLPFSARIPTLTPRGIGIENPRVAGSIPALGTEIQLETAKPNPPRPALYRRFTPGPDGA